MDNPGEMTTPSGITTPNQAPGTGSAPGAGTVKDTGEPKLSREMAEILAPDGEAPAPETVDDFASVRLTIPDRLKEDVPAEDIKAYEDAARQIARRMGVTAEQAQEFLQGLANLNFDLTEARLGVVDQENENAVKEQLTAWRREIAADPQLGGHRYTTTMALAEEGARRLGGNPGHVAFLRYWRGEEAFPGPLLVKMLHLAAATMREDRINGLILNKAPEKRTLAQALYGDKQKGR